ncbi:MAG: HU family DNA-binding protein [Hyphomonadaceae bacterium]|nr:HU family DNA-binding protein [Hyphomonadaceae bacterium]
MARFFVERGIPVNKAEFVNAVADATNEPRARAAELVDAVFDCITVALKKGDDVRLPAFGVFVVANAAARTARNPKTGEEINVPASRKAKFRPGKALKEALDS